MLRLDRALEAQQKNQTLTAGGVAVTVDRIALESYSRIGSGAISQRLYLRS